MLFTIVSGAARAQNSHVAILDPKSGQYKALIHRGRRAEYVETGHLIYEVERYPLGGALRPGELNKCWAIRCLSSTGSQVLNFSVTRLGTLVYAPANAPGGSLVWVTRQGR